nr:zinc-ribbon domain-containing protein [Bacillus infantis]
MEKEILVGVSSKNYKHYEDLGYFVDRYVDKKNRSLVKRGTKIVVKVTDLPRGSNVRVTKVCDDCGKHVNNQYKIILDLRRDGDGKDRCKKCGNIRRGGIQKNSVSYENSLEFCARLNKQDYLLEEFSRKNSRTPNNIAYKSNDSFFWNCKTCHGEYKTKLSNRANGKNCPFCSGRKVLLGYNDLWTTHPHIASLLNDKNRGYEITAGSNRKENFKCAECELVQAKIVWNVNRQGFSCSRCGDGLSYAEKFLFSLLSQIGLNFEREKRFDWSDGRYFDFFIPPNTIVETHGLQHYSEQGFGSLNGRTLTEEIKNDQYKLQLAKNNGITNYVILDCKESNMEYLKNSILTSDLSIIYDLANIDWKMCNEFSCKNTLLKVACDLWNEGVKSTVAISKRIKVERATVIRYLKKGASELNWCSYDPKEEQKKRGRMVAGKNKISVVQLTKSSQYIKTWSSLKQAEEELGIHNISSVCHGVIKSSGGFLWVFEKDYVPNKIITYETRTRAIAVVQLDLNNNLLGEYSSMTSASICTGIDSKYISRVCSGQRRTSGGFKWKYADEYFNDNKEIMDISNIK